MSKVSEVTREREVLKFAPHLHKLANTGPPTIEHATTTSSPDAALTAFAQLGAFRLNTARCLISIFDRNYQYIVAEATQASNLAPNVKGPDNVWLGGTAIPRSLGTCEHVLVATTDHYTESHAPATSPLSPDVRPPATALPVSIVPDLGEDERFDNRPYIHNPPYNRFYAGVPIRSPRGINIGVYCVFDDHPRDALDDRQVGFLREISKTITGYLESKRSTENSRRSERMVRGIGSFVEGKSTMSRWWVGPNTSSFEHHGWEGALNSKQQVIQQEDERREAERENGAALRPEPMPIQSSSSSVIVKARSESQTPNPPLQTTSPIPSSPTQTTPKASDDAGFSNSLTPTEHMDSTSVGTLTTASVSYASTFNTSPTTDTHVLEIKNAFGRAANVIRESIEVEGVLFLDASVGSFGGLVDGRGRGSSMSLDSQLSHSNSSSEENLLTVSEETEDKDCNVYGFSTSTCSSIDEGASSNFEVSVSEKLLRTLLRRYPTGKVFNFDETGDLTSGESDEEKALSKQFADGRPIRVERVSRNFLSRQNEGKSIISIFPGARSVALVPLWDSHKEKHFAGAFMWTRTPARIFTMEGELSYLRGFSMTIMAEVSRLDTVQADKSKSDVLGSLSHELRSPLHGIVAAVELLHDTQLDAFQGDVLHSMESCGRTLLDVLDHLLDYSKMNRFVKASKDQSKNIRHNRVPLTERQKSFESRITALFLDVELDALAEETIESIVTGFNFQKMSIAQIVDQERSEYYDVSAMRKMDSIAAIESFGHHHRRDGVVKVTLGPVSIYIDIDPCQSWLCNTQPGALRRVIMNVLGNALKFTTQGCIVVSMKQEAMSSKGHRRRPNLVLTVSDTGRGISGDFLKHHVFTPFAQEDPLNPGTGLGLSLVNHITKTLGGTVSIESLLGRGTTVVVKMPLSSSHSHPGADSSFARHVAALSGLRVSLRGLKSANEAPGLHGRASRTELELMETLCRDWLHLEIIAADCTDVRADLIICSDLSLDQVAPEGWQILPPVVVICRSAIVAHSLSNAHRSTRNDIFEFISQPAGPRKVAKALILALGRWNDFKANLPLSSESSSSANQTPFFSSPVTPATTTQGATPSVEKEEPEMTPTPSSLEVSDPVPHSASQETLRGLASGTVLPFRPANFLNVSPAYPAVDSPDSSDNGRGKFLLVDDNKINIQILASFMKKLSRSYKSAMNGLEALEAYAAQPGRYCCILMDLSMPVMDGLESTRRIRELERSQKMSPCTIIALTGLASASTQQEAYASGIDVFMTKPVRMKNLAQVLEEKGIN